MTRRWTFAKLGAVLGVLAAVVWLAMLRPHGGVELSGVLFPLLGLFARPVFPGAVPNCVWYLGVLLHWPAIGAVIDLLTARRPRSPTDSTLTDEPDVGATGLRLRDRVRIVRLLKPPEDYVGCDVRPPAVGDVGSLIWIIRRPDLPDSYLVESSSPATDGADVWQCTFSAEELEPAEQDATR